MTYHYPYRSFRASGIGGEEAVIEGNSSLAKGVLGRSLTRERKALGYWKNPGRKEGIAPESRR